LDNTPAGDAIFEMRTQHVFFAIGAVLAWSWFLASWALRGLGGGWFCIRRMRRDGHAPCSDLTWDELDFDRRFWFHGTPLLAASCMVSLLVGGVLMLV
jgi:hypothetical protein